MKEKKCIDLVIGGPDFSGTSTQVKDLIDYFTSTGKKVKDLRGTEMDALFHVERFGLSNNYTCLKEFLNDPAVSENQKKDFVFEISNFLTGEVKVASCFKTPSTLFINPDSADVWVLEEPTNRGAGQVCRTIEQRRSDFDSRLNPVSAALAHQAYRTDEFFRFRGPLRENEKIIIRSRSEESACYQIYDSNHLSSGISLEKYLELPGNKIAFSNPPTHIFVVAGYKNWSIEDYKKLRDEKIKSKNTDDHERDVSYQLLVNRRYATEWLEELYENGCERWGVEAPQIKRFDIYKSKEEIKSEMINEVERILETTK